MTVGDALIRLSARPDDQAAAAELLKQATRIAAGALKLPEGADEVQEAAQTCVVQLWERAHLGSLRLESVASADAYAHRCVRNTCLERFRSTQRHTKLHQYDRGGEEERRSVENHAAPSITDDALEQAEAAQQLEELRVTAREQLAARFRDGFDESFQDALRLMEGQSTVEALQAKGEASGTGGTSIARARNRSYKAQQRLRQYLESGIVALETAGRWGPDEAAFARRFLRLFVRCQSSTATRISGKGEPRHTVRHGEDS